MATITRDYIAAPRIHMSGKARPGLWARLVGYILAEYRVHRSLRELSALDDHALHDLGLTRGGAEFVVRHGRVPLGPIEFAPGLINDPGCTVTPAAWTEWR